MLFVANACMHGLAAKRRSSELNVAGSRQPLATIYVVCCWSIAQISVVYFRGYLYIYVINLHCTKRF